MTTWLHDVRSAATVSFYYKLSLFNAHTMILIFHIFMNVNKLCLNELLWETTSRGDFITPNHYSTSARTKVLKLQHHYSWTEPVGNGRYTISRLAVRSQPVVSHSWLVEWCFTSVHRNRRLIRDGSPGRPPRHSHSSWALVSHSSW